MPRALPRTFHVKSFGCQMNVYDGERMAELLAAQGMTAAADGEAADLVVLNTCHIREKATEKVYSDIGRIMKTSRAAARPADDRGRRLRRAGRRRGDRAPRARRSISSSARRPITVCRRWSREAAARPSRRSIPTCRRRPNSARCPARRKVGPSRLPHRAGRVRQILHLLRRALHARRRGQSRPWAAMIDEAKALVDAGAREITLLGQNVNAWAGEDEAGACGASTA